MMARRSLTFCVGMALAVAATATACGSTRPQSSNGFIVDSAGTSLDGLRGDVLDPPTPEPSITMTDDHGSSYDVEKETTGKVVLMYFGYTHCPDICPLIMADTAQALRDVPAAVRSSVKVVFITVDPHRDTLPVLRNWLGHYDPSFVGLRAPISQVVAAQKAAGVPVSSVNPHGKHGYSVQHSGELLAFTPDHEAHVVYTAGPGTITDLAHDLSTLTRDRKFA